MATKKASSTKKAAAKKPAVSRASSTKTKVTTVKAAAVSAPKARSRRLHLGKAPLVAAGLAELIGTFMLAGALISGQGQPIWALFALTGIVLIIGGISGAHVNPLITVGAWVSRKIEGKRALVYLLAQFIGALLAFVVLSTFVKQAPAVSQEAALYGQQTAELFKVAAIPQGKEWVVLAAELLGATIFGFAVASAVREKRERLAAAFTVGLGLFIALLVAGSAAGVVSASAIVNPAVAVALQAFNVPMDTLGWTIAVYGVVPLLGGAIGFYLQDILREENPEVTEGDQLVTP